MTGRIKIGHCYIAKLSKKQAPVRVDSTNPDGGWNVRNLETGRLTVVKEKDKFLRECEDADMTTEVTPNRRQRSAAPVSPSAEQNTLVDASLDLPETKPERKLSVLDAAHKVLLEVNGELSTPEIIKIAIEKGYWTTGGKTPASTLHAAISRDIAKNGNTSRFLKGERGKFLANLPY
ncbi:MAG: winged helix-turn-helix domain-containing protein [Thermoguttaceae bacterium]